MKLKLILIIILSIAIMPVFAQTAPVLFSVKGITTDSVTKKPVDYVTVNLRNAAKQLVRTSATKADGTFNFEKLPAGKYLISIVSVGYNPKTVPVDLTDNAKPVVDLGSISISEQNNQLKAVAISVDKPIVKQDIDKLTYDLQADPESKSNNVLDMMRKVPMITVDADDNIQLKGNTNYKILINGRPSSMVERDAKNILKSMPASTIQSIEVITNPPAKYDAEGLGGIINIVTSKKIDNGYNASLNVSQRGPVGGPGMGGSLSFKQGKFGLTANTGGNLSNSPATTNTSYRTTTGVSSTNLTQSNSRESDSKSGYLGTELSYEIDSLNLISVQFNINGNGSDGTTNQASQLNGSGGIMQGYSLANVSENSGRGMDLALNYQLGFKKSKARLLTFSYRFFNFNNTQDANLTASNRVNYNTPNYRQHNEGESSEQTFQIDYVHPVKKLNIEGGIKGIIRDNNSNFQYRSLNASTGNFDLDPTRSNQFDNNQNVYGAYNSYTYNLKNWGFKAGARIEVTTIDADFVSTSSQLNKNFFNIIPSVSVQRKFKNMSSMTLAYNQRINRPGIWQLNPFVDRSNPNFESAGNPNLKPAVVNNFQLTYTKSKKGSLNLVGGYQFFNDLIMPVVAFDPATNITRNSFDNTGKARLFMVGMNINYPITKKWTAGINSQVAHGRVQGFVNGSLVKNEGFMYGGSLNSGYRFEKGWRINANAFGNGPDLSIQGSSNSYFSWSLGASKDIVKDKLTFSASTANPLNKFRTNIRNSFGPDFTQINNNQTYFRTYNLSLNYRFGKLKEAIKKNRRGISNDDVQGGGANN